LLAELGRRTEFLGFRRVGQVDRLGRHLDVPSLGCFTARAMPRCFTCGSAKVWSMVLIPAHGTLALSTPRSNAPKACLGDGGDALVDRLAMLQSARLGDRVFRMIHQLGCAIAVAQRLNMLSA